MKEIQRTSVTDAVVDSIRAMIESGQWTVGEKLPPEAVFCEQLKVSRTCVREGIRVLQALGYVELKPGKGAFVGDFREKRSEKSWMENGEIGFGDFVEVRSAIESLAVRLAVERAAGEQLQELEQVHQEFVRAAEQRDLEQMRLEDEKFHRRITLFSRNQLLINISGIMQKEFQSRYCAAEPLGQEAVEAHVRILECFRKRDPGQAAIEMNRHLSKD